MEARADDNGLIVHDKESDICLEVCDKLLLKLLLKQGNEMVISLEKEVIW